MVNTDIDYFLISQLRPSEVYDYINKRKKSFYTKNRNVHFKNLGTLVIWIGVEFWALLLTFFVGLAVNTLMSIIGIILLLLFFVVMYTLVKNVSKTENLLAKIHSTRLKAIRQNKTVILPEDEIEIGDTVLISEGEVVPFDVRVIESNSLIVDESKVFNENKKVGKSAVTLPRKDFKIYELSNIIFSNSYVIKGSGKGIVINKKSTTSKHYGLLTHNFNKMYVFFLVFLSFILSALVFYMTMNIWVSTTFLLTFVFVAGRYIAVSKLYLKYLITKRLLANSIVIPSITKIDSYNEVKKAIIKIDSFSFESYIPKFFLVVENKYYSVEDLLLPKENIPKEFIYCFVIVSFLYKKTKNFYLKVTLNPIINVLSSIGIHNEMIKNCKVIEYNITNEIDSISTIRLRDEKEIFIGIVSLKAYTRQFGKPYRTSYNGEGVVILYKDVSDHETLLKPILVIEANKYDYKIEMEKFEKEMKFFFFSDLSVKELSAFFQEIGISLSKFSFISAGEILNIPQEQQKFFLEKFNLLTNLSNKDINHIKKMLAEKNEILLDCFIEINQSDIGIMKIPYFGTFFNKNNLILTATKDLLTPFRLMEILENLRISLKKMESITAFLVISFLFVSLVFCVYGNIIISVFSPIVVILIVSEIPKYFVRKYCVKGYGNESYKNKP